jgi:sulfite exporter TauE/SafE
MTDFIISPLLLGLSTGVYCFVYCIPFIAPIMVSKERRTRENFYVIGKFVLGRLVGYLIFGAVAGYLGGRLAGVNFELFTLIALAALSLLLILHALGIWQGSRSSCCGFINRHERGIPFFMGMLMGVNACPPFLLSLTYVLTLQSAVKGIVYFFMFFIGTTVYFVPMFFLGYLNRIREFQLVGRISAIAVGLVFLGYSIYGLSRLKG